MNLQFRFPGHRLPVAPILITTIVVCFFGLIIFPLIGIIRLFDLVQQAMEPEI